MIYVHSNAMDAWKYRAMWGGINKSLGHRLWINGSLNIIVFNLSMKLIKTEIGS